MASTSSLNSCLVANYNETLASSHFPFYHVLVEIKDQILLWMDGFLTSQISNFKHRARYLICAEDIFNDKLLSVQTVCTCLPLISATE